MNNDKAMSSSIEEGKTYEVLEDFDIRKNRRREAIGRRKVRKGTIGKRIEKER